MWIVAAVCLRCIGVYKINQFVVAFNYRYIVRKDVYFESLWCGRLIIDW